MLPGVRVLGVVLAAGGGTRMGGPKALLELGGRRLLDLAVDVLRAGGCDDVVAVVPAGLGIAADVRCVENVAAATGMRSSLQCALAVADDVDGLATLLVDTPGIGAAAVRATLAAWRAAPARITVASYNGWRGHPTVMAVPRWREAVRLAGPDEGARVYLRRHPADVDEVAVPGDPADLDTPADLARWRATHPG